VPELLIQKGRFTWSPSGRRSRDAANVVCEFDDRPLTIGSGRHNLKIKVIWMGGLTIIS